MKNFWRKFSRETDGNVALLAVLGLIVLAGVASLAIDVGQLYTVRTQLQNTADAAALAAAAKLIVDNGAGEVTRDSATATTKAYEVARQQAINAGLADPGAGTSRTDMTVTYGVWNLAVAPSSAWTDLGSAVSGGSAANAVRVTMNRAAGLTYGPVTNFFGAVLPGSFISSAVSATATAYLGYTSSTTVGGVDVPIALPESLINSAQNEGGGSWMVRLFKPQEAVATSYVSTQFKDLGSNTFYQTNYSKPQIDTAKAYMFVVNSSDSVPGTINNNLTYAKNSGTSGTAVRAMERGTRLYPLSEYQWVSNISTIFGNLKLAWNAQKGSLGENPNDPAGKWNVIVPVYSTTQPTAQLLREKLFHLARFFSLGVPEAQACFTFWSQSYPGGNVPIYVSKFATVFITNVTTATGTSTTIPPPSGYCNDCTNSSVYNKQVSGVYVYTGSTTSERIANCMMTNTQDCRNVYNVTIEVPTGSSTVGLPPVKGGSTTTSTTVPSATSGAYSSIPKLVK